MGSQIMSSQVEPVCVLSPGFGRDWRDEPSRLPFACLAYCFISSWSSPFWQSRTLVDVAAMGAWSRQRLLGRGRRLHDG